MYMFKRFGISQNVKYFTCTFYNGTSTNVTCDNDTFHFVRRKRKSILIDMNKESIYQPFPSTRWYV